VALVLVEVRLLLHQENLHRLEIFPETLDFPEYPDKTPEYPMLFYKIVLSGEFLGFTYSTPL
jgi:hypothetical protein